MLRIVSMVLLLSMLTLGCRSETNNTSSGAGASGGSTNGSGAAGGSGGSGGAGGGGAAMPTGAVIVRGTVVTPGEAFEGEVRVLDDVIDCVAPADGCTVSGDTIVETGGVIAPGLIDTHNHILFDIFDGDDWAPMPQACTVASDCDVLGGCSGGKCACIDTVCRYNNHDQWPNDPAYGLMLDYKQCLDDASQGKPPWCPQTYDGDGKLKCEMDKWGELKGLVSGTTAIVGLPGISSKCFGSLARSIDVAQNDLGSDKVQTATGFPSKSSANGVCANFADGDTEAWLAHIAEGFDQKSLNEFNNLFNISDADPGCLFAPQTTITHGCALGPTEFDSMAAAGMKLTWSPASNHALYGRTTNIPAALDAGLTISLAPDWSMGGSQNLLDEVRFASAYNADHWHDSRLDPPALLTMITSNAAQVLGLDKPGGIGRLAVGYKADLVVYDSLENDPYETILAASPAEVQLVMVGGMALYGDMQHLDLVLDKGLCDGIDICGDSKFLCVAEASIQVGDKLDQRFDDIQVALAAALLDLDNIAVLPDSACNNMCAADEQCFERQVHPQVPSSNCGGPCPVGEACFQRFQSGNNKFACLSINTCAPAKTKTMSPLVPLVKCL